jgi:excinuclease ABC subunit A
MPRGERESIRVFRARTHNLRDVDVELPRGALTVITGVSGSGKSSLAFDTLYAEGQRRYVESMSTYARQFLERMQRPDVDAVEGIPPAIAIEQQNSTRNARSTVGTATEISDFLRLLFARVGEPRCPACDVPVTRTTPQSAADALFAQHAGVRAQVVARVDPAAREVLRRDGWLRLYDGSALSALDDWTRPGALPVLVDRVALRPADRSRLAEAIATAFRLGAGGAEIWLEGRARALRLGEGMRCTSCQRELKPPQPRLFSYHSPLGACESCQGFGRTTGIDLEKIIPDERRTLQDGAIAPWRTEKFREWQEWLEEWAPKRAFRLPLDVPFRDLSDEQRRLVIEGFGKFTGIRGWFAYLERKRYKMHYRILLARYRGYSDCPDCRGSRLRPEARAWRVAGRTISELEGLAVADLRAWLAEAGRALGRQAGATAAPLLAELDVRLGYLERVGLGYLTLLRQTRSLSGGEAQRIRLAQALGVLLTDTLYVLDEPSVGLHPRDTTRLLGVLRTLTERGNTVVVVEHDADLIGAADHVVDLGPGAGVHGGRVVFAGPPAELLRRSCSATGEALRRRRLPARERRPARQGSLFIRGARAHNLKNLTVEIPLGLLVCASGVSGSGKSTLMVEVLYANWLRQQQGAAVPGDLARGECDGIDGFDQIDEIVLCDQSPLARSSRSNPATYLGAWGELRKLLARSEGARQLGLTASHFSFNTPGGRCEVCQGQGAQTLEMHFLADVTLPCEVCQGKRFAERTLGARLGGYNVAQILELTVDQALAVFREHPRVTDRLGAFSEVGLGYLRLGQPTSTLSGGEAQRLKLAAYLGEGQDGRRLFLLDEPTTGLHAADVEVLLGVLERLRAAGNTVVAIEHNLDFLYRADYLIDLGPEGGESGGRLVACGTPEQVAQADCHTGRHLARRLGLSRRKVRHA